MAQPLKQISIPTTRTGQVRYGIWIELATIVWMVIEASVARSAIAAAQEKPNT
jgi:hypothetical protein